MQDYFDVVAWLTGLGTWLFGAVVLFAAIAVFDFNPLWLALTFPIPFISVATLYALRLRSLPKLARQLGDLDDKKRKRAFEQLFLMGQSSVDAFLQILMHQGKKKKSLNGTGSLRQSWLLRVWDDSKLKRQSQIC